MRAHKSRSKPRGLHGPAEHQTIPAHEEGSREPFIFISLALQADKRFKRAVRGLQWPSSLRSLGIDALRPRVPSADIAENDTEIIVRAEAPGGDKDSLDVSITDRTLRISDSSVLSG